MLGCKVVVVEEPHFENSVVNTNAHVGNGYTRYYLQPIKIKLIYIKRKIIILINICIQ